MFKSFCSSLFLLVALVSSAHAATDSLNSKINVVVGSDEKFGVSFISKLAEPSTSFIRVGEKKYKIESVIYPSGLQGAKSHYKNELKIYEIGSDSSFQEVLATDIYVAEAAESSISLAKGNGKLVAVDLEIISMSAEQVAEFEQKAAICKSPSGSLLGAQQAKSMFDAIAAPQIILIKQCCTDTGPDGTTLQCCSTGPTCCWVGPMSCCN